MASDRTNSATADELFVYSLHLTDGSQWSPPQLAERRVVGWTTKALISVTQAIYAFATFGLPSIQFCGIEPASSEFLRNIYFQNTLSSRKYKLMRVISRKSFGLFEDSRFFGIRKKCDVEGKKGALKLLKIFFQEYYRCEFS